VVKRKKELKKKKSLGVPRMHVALPLRAPNIFPFLLVREIAFHLNNFVEQEINLQWSFLSYYK
jgi:hypothetical protein